jgi:hypothetical protein
LVHNHLTGEPHEPEQIYVLYVGLGKLAGLLGLDVQRTFHAAEIAARAVLLVAVYLFGAAIFPTVSRRRLAFILVLFSSGLGVWFVLLDALVPYIGDNYALFTQDLYRPDVTTFLVLFTPPHGILGLALLLVTARWYLASWSARTLRAPVLTGLTALGLSLINPYSAATVCAVLPAHLGFMWARHRRVPLGPIMSVGAAVAAAAPFLVYTVFVIGGDPFWGIPFGRQNVTPSPPLIALALGLAPLLTLAAAGLPGFLRNPTPGRWLVVVYIVVSLALMYAPLGVGFQRRFGHGLPLMLGLIATIGLEPFWRPGSSDRLASRCLGRQLLTFGLLLALFASTAGAYAFKLQATSPTCPCSQDGAFQPVALKEAGQWLAAVMEPHDVVLSETFTGNYLASVVPGRVFVGHAHATVRYTAKEDAMVEFYRRDDDPEARRQFLLANSIHYVVYGPRERALGATLPADPFLTPVYATAEVAVYAVRWDTTKPL